MDSKPATPARREFLDVSRRATIRDISTYLIKFSADLQNAEISPLNVPKSDYTTDSLPVTLIIFGTLTGSIQAALSIYI